MTRTTNQVTGKKQFAAATVQQEIAMGLQALPDMAARHGGLDPDSRAQRAVDTVGQRLLAGHASARKAQSVYQFDFHLLADVQTINAFALPGGQVFITRALFDQLTTEGQLAGVLGHEIGHVIERHGAQHIEQAKLTQGLTGAAVLASYDPSRPETQRTAAVAAMIGQLVGMKFGRGDELESDVWGVDLLADAGYDPNAMIGVMEILASAGGGKSKSEFFSTHPNPKNRIERIHQAIRARFPNGIPADLTP